MSAVREILLVGGGGYATELAEYLIEDEKKRGGAKLIGFVDDYTLEPELKRTPFLGKLSDVTHRADLGVVVTSGMPRFRAESIAKVKSLGFNLINYIHHSAIVSSDAIIGEGSIICPFSIVNSGANVGIGVSVNVHCSVGHGASVGDFSVLSPYSALNGWAKVGSRCFLGTRATVFPKVVIGDSCTIDSHSYVKADVTDKMIVSIRGQYNVISNRLEK